MQWYYHFYGSPDLDLYAAIQGPLARRDRSQQQIHRRLDEHSRYGPKDRLERQTADSSNS